IKKEYGKAKVIIGNNVVAHIDDHRDMVKGVNALLKDDGVFIFEAPYLVDMFENLTFDTIYHEHLSFLSLRPLIRFFEQFGLQIFDVELKSVQGHSFRVFVSKAGVYSVSVRVKKAVEKELRLKMNKFSSYLKLANEVRSQKKKLLTILKNLKSQGKSIAGYGAPAKGNTLLNYYGIGHETLDYLTEALPTKIGLWSPGMHIPVIDIETAHKSPPDYFLMLAWNYKEKIFGKEKAFRDKGGKFIIPVGGVKIL
ncbi:MAG: class I SAM-dependent methyltransferase, partial [Patescibacteria group bacterium]